MSEELVSTWMAYLTQMGTDLGVRLIGAVVLWIVGRMLIGMAKGLVLSSLKKQNVDETLHAYAQSALGILLNVVLIIAILGVFGVETTTFAGLLAAAGVAIGMAWSGLLSNFAAGAFMIVLRPFKVGDFVSAGGVTGTVREIGLFVTTMDTPDNVRTFVGNNTIFSGTIQNYSANPFRRVELKAQLAHSVDPDEAIALLKERLAHIPNVAASPAPDVEILEFTLAGPVLAVRPYCHTDDYWQVYFDTNKLIREAFGSKGYAIPEQHFAIRQG